MSELVWLKVENVLNLALTHGALWFYVFIFVSSVFENIFPPYPGDMITFAGGYLAGTGHLTFPLVFLCAGFGCLGGAMILYLLGKGKGRKLFLKRERGVFDRAHLEKVERWFRRYGEKVLILSRFLAGVRSVVALAAGVGNVSLKKMAIYTSISIILWNGIILLLAFKVQQNWQEILQILQIYNKVVLAVVALIALIWLLRAFRGKSVNGTNRKVHTNG
ncbi:MAG: DedA family protein [Candidatus Zixiibacteriota bacterium]|nr:MAG: DedA family protein [candidate division Zixibacteria bacterium]